MKELRFPKINQITISGHVTKDIMIKLLPSGKMVGDFNIAHNSSWKDSKGDWQEKASFYKVVVWGKYAEAIGNLIIKGTPLIISGAIEKEEYKDSDGITKRITKITADSIHVLSKETEYNNG